MAHGLGAPLTDLEFDRAANPGVDGDAQVQLLVMEVVHLMKAGDSIMMDDVLLLEQWLIH